MGKGVGKSLKMQDFRSLSRDVWHQRYLEQAQWTSHIRQHIFKKINPHLNERILEIGSGTGAVISALLMEGYFNLTGIDIDFPSLLFSSLSHDPIHLAQANGLSLPFSANTFGITFCHYLLMWVKSPLQILAEMCRVTQPNGWVLSIAEPDHQARIDYPPPLEKLGNQQTQALENQGIDVSIGRKLRSLFHQAGLADVEAGILGALWDKKIDPSEDKTEWMMITADLQDRLTTRELSDYHSLDQQTRQTGERILYIPTFYALGRTK